VSKRRTARFRALMLQACKPWRSAILQKSFEELRPFLINVDQHTLVDVIRFAWTQPELLHTALCAALGHVWVPASPPKSARINWATEQILQNNWVERQQRPRLYSPSWSPQRLRFKRAAVSVSHPLGNWHCTIDNADWTSFRQGMTIDGDTVPELQVCPHEERPFSSRCIPDSISLSLRENLAGELQLVLTTTSHCLCYWYEHIGYGNPPDHFEETMTFAMVDSDEDDDDDTEDEDEDSDEDDDDDEEEDEEEDEDDDVDVDEDVDEDDDAT
jgi:hypothetical protein